MTRHQVLELLITREIPRDLGSIEASLRAITSRIDAADDEAEYDEVHHRLDELLDARERARVTAASRGLRLIRADAAGQAACRADQVATGVMPTRPSAA